MIFADDADGSRDGLSKKLMKIPAVLILLVINSMSFIVICHYDIVIPIYGTIKLKDSPTLVGAVVSVAGLCYAAFAAICGVIVDKKGKEILLVAIGSFGIMTISIVISTYMLLEGHIPLLLFGGFFMIVSVLTPLTYVPILSLLLKTSKAYGIADSLELNVFFSNMLMTAVIMGQLIGNGTAGIMYQHLGIAVSEYIFAGIVGLLGVLVFVVVVPKLRTSEHHLLIPDTSVNNST